MYLRHVFRYSPLESAGPTYLPKDRYLVLTVIYNLR